MYCKRFLISLFLIVLLGSCKRNHVVIAEDKLVDVMADLHYAQSVRTISGRVREDFSDRDVDNLVYQKYGVSKLQVDSSLKFYATDTHRFEKIYDRVLEKLLKLETEIKAGSFLRSEIKLDSLAHYFSFDSVYKNQIIKELWDKNRKMIFPDDNEKGTGIYRVNLLPTVGPELLLKYSVLINEKEKSDSIFSSMIIEYVDGSKDSTGIYLKNSLNASTYQLMLKVDKNKIPAILRGEFAGRKVYREKYYITIDSIRLYQMNSMSL